MDAKRKTKNKKKLRRQERAEAFTGGSLNTLLHTSRR